MKECDSCAMLEVQLNAERKTCDYWYIRCKDAERHLMELRAKLVPGDFSTERFATMEDEDV